MLFDPQVNGAVIRTIISGMTDGRPVRVVNVTQTAAGREWPF
jgi:hypothetical protein